ncbi:MAG: sigma-70 family RNA polymerase sigma factor [Bacteroidales bacterium]|nr:sigma-70 family RNA polymerase sigma factor [Bacteroidales bacterium]
MESDIIKKAISGDPEALSFLIDKYKNVAYNLALSIVRNQEDAKDITQDSFLKVLENIGRFRNESKFSTWLYRIVYNQSVVFSQCANRVHKVDYVLVIANPEHHENPETNEESEIRIKELYDAIQLLNDSDRHVIMLFYLAEKSIRDISQITGFSVANIKVILHRARKKLYEIMKDGNK